MQVNRAATMNLEWVDAHASIADSAKKMEAANVGLLLVADNRVLLGVLTDRDIVTRCVAPGMSVEQTTAMEIMSDPVICVDMHADIAEAAEMMAENKVRRLVVLDSERRPVGVLSLDDIAFNTRGDSTAGKVLEDIAQSSNSAVLFRGEGNGAIVA